MKLRQGMVTVAVLLASFILGGWLLGRNRAEDRDLYLSAERLDQVVDLIGESYVDSLDAAELYGLALDGMLDALGDPYTSILRGEELRSMRMGLEGDYDGVGLRIEMADGWLMVITPIAGTPAESAGLEPGDRIVEVDGRSTFGWSSEDAVLALRGDAGTSVDLSIVRPGIDEVIEFTLERATIPVSSVRFAGMVTESVGYIELETVGEGSAEQVREAVESVLARGAKKLILDLRFNPGGLLNEGIDIADLFLDEGAGIASTSGRGFGSTATFDAKREQLWPDLPIIVLVNGYSASAAEIIAGALQDNDRALVLGERTFGKGLVQRLLPLSSDEQLRVTSSRWYTPSGRTIHRDRDRWGVLEHIVADSTSDTSAFLSVGGRELVGGGGIIPDRELGAVESSVSAPPGFQDAIGSEFPVFRDVLVSYALEVREQAQAVDTSFQVGRRMVEEFRNRLGRRDVVFSNAEWTSARSFIEWQLKMTVIRFSLGRDSEMQLVLAHDPMIEEAARLLEAVVTPRELVFEAAQSN
ncbi:MAG: S41 family peptidase [Gemmatimonadota bacterium]|nr:S41 family peptidase [Gemmatimonadota bacterium]